MSIGDSLGDIHRRDAFRPGSILNGLQRLLANLLSSSKMESKPHLFPYSPLRNVDYPYECWLESDVSERGEQRFVTAYMVLWIINKLKVCQNVLYFETLKELVTAHQSCRNLRFL